MRKPDFGVSLGQADHMRIEVAKRGGEEQGGTVLGNHALHGALHRLGFRHVFFFDDLDAGHLFEFGGRLGMRLVVPKIVPGADIDESNGQRRLRQDTQGNARSQGSNACRARTEQQFATIPQFLMHDWPLSMVESGG